jgi:hypothetical protein
VFGQCKFFLMIFFVCFQFCRLQDVALIASDDIQIYTSFRPGDIVLADVV